VTDWIEAGMPHLIVVPILLPMLTAAALLLMPGRRTWRALVDIASGAAGLLFAAALLAWVDRHAAAGAVGVYLPSNWDVPFGIVLAVDRLSAMMLVLTGTVSLASVIFGAARWDGAGVHYHALSQIQLMGINGAFLSADVFNLFVFFEVMLAASYGLLLHGSGRARVRAGLHYIAVNLLASTLFLIGVAVLYGITGTLNLADMAQKIPRIPAEDRSLLHAGVAILGMAFLVKAAMWPLNFWLTPAYAAASPPVAALFVILSKVGIYSVLRVWTLLGSTAPDPLPLGGVGLVYGGFATLAFAAIGMLTTQDPRRLAGFALVMSSGTVLAVIGFDHSAMLGAALYYLLGSTLAASALFLLDELIARAHVIRAVAKLHDEEADHLPFYVELAESTGRRRPVAASEEEDESLVGQVIPAAVAVLGLSFIACALLIAGLPPLAGFLAKFALLDALFDAAREGALVGGFPMPVTGWILLVLLIGSSLFATIALARAGIRHFWVTQDRPVPHLRAIEFAPVAALLLAAAVLTVRPDPLLRYTNAAAAGLLQPAAYVDAVMTATPVPGPARAMPAAGGGVAR
jgi:multicomponent K+:H+ antiporter subunit D